MSRALLVIDIQNDYFEGGAFPLWHTEAVLGQIEQAVAQAQASDTPVIIIQHVADPAQGLSPFFNEGTEGVEVHPRLKAAAPEAPVVRKAYADSFEQTTLQSVLHEVGATELLICGMMTQNCVTHTAISKAAEPYEVTVLVDACTTVNEMLHLIALHALSTRVALKPVAEALPAQ